MEEQKTLLGKIVRERRRALGLSRDRLAELAGVSTSTIYRIECEDRDTTQANRRMVLAALNGSDGTDWAPYWIPCEKQKPVLPNGVNGHCPGSFLACFEDGTIKLVSGIVEWKHGDDTAFYDNADFDSPLHPKKITIDGEEFDIVPERIVAWMPLPPPYMEGKTECK